MISSFDVEILEDNHFASSNMDDLIDSMARRHLSDRRYVSSLAHLISAFVVSRSRLRDSAVASLVTARPWVSVNIFNCGEHKTIVVGVVM